jgi:GntR family transcriptional regulator
MTMKATIDRSSPVPLYRQIKDIVQSEIQSSSGDDDLLLTERQLMERFKVSRAPIRQALKELSDEGFLYRQRGQGTFPVRGLQLNQSALQLGGLTSYLRDQGIDVATTVRECGRIDPPDEVRGKLHLDEDSKAFYVSRVITAHGEPLIWSRIYLDVPPSFDPSAADIEAAGSLFTLLDEDPVLALSQGEHSIYADWAKDEDAEHLGIQVRDPVLVIDTSMYTRAGVLEGYRRLVHKAIDYKFVFGVTR